MPRARFTATSDGRLAWPGGAARCALGRAGVIEAAAKQEGDGATPLGVWPLRLVLFRADRLPAPATGLPREAIIPEAGWSDDPADPFYNRPVVLPYPPRHERLWREDRLYDLILPLGYNDDPVVAGRGSAIFLHVAREDYQPTEGCVACALEDLIALIAEARPGDCLEIAR